MDSTILTGNFSRYDTADYLNSSEDMLLYLEACLEENDPALIAHAFGVIARARGMTQLAKDTGISREGLYKAPPPMAIPSLPLS